MNSLIQSLSERWRPEQVVVQILDLLGLDLSPDERHKLSSAVPRWARSSMATQFAKAATIDKQLKTASELFPTVLVPTSRSFEALTAYVAALKQTIRMTGTDFKGDRLAQPKRIEIRSHAWVGAATLPLGHRAYNKRFRFIARFEEIIGKRAETGEMREPAQIAKSRLAFKLTPEMLTDRDTLCFVAYMTAALNKRSMFTFGEQDRAYDTIADVLFKRLTARANWLAVAYVHPEPEVLAQLTEQQRGLLVGVWYSVMHRAVRVLDAQVSKGGIDLEDLIVQRGNDSSTWNEAAGAYNKARDGWVNTLYALGMQDMLDGFLPGKALRLMAADVAYGHRVYGSGLDPNTAVWRKLPKPWEVMLHQKVCTRAMVDDACAGLEKVGGWSAPKTKTVAPFKPTPELVHGVVISSPDLAERLRHAGYFAGPSKGAASGFVAFDRAFDGKTVSVGETQAEAER